MAAGKTAHGLTTCPTCGRLADVVGDRIQWHRARRSDGSIGACAMSDQVLVHRQKPAIYAVVRGVA